MSPGGRFGTVEPMPKPAALSTRAGIRLGIATVLGAVALALAAPPAVRRLQRRHRGPGRRRTADHRDHPGQPHRSSGLSATNAQVIEVFTGLTRASEFGSAGPRSASSPSRPATETTSSPSPTASPPLPTSIAGGAGADRLTGGAGDDVFLGGADADTVDGREGADLLLLGSGDDQAVWAPGRGRDVVEGQTGNDLVTVDGTIGGDHLEILANGSRLKIFRPGDVDHVDAAGAEQLLTRPGAGPDKVIVNDLTGVAARRDRRGPEEARTRSG